MKPPMIKGLVSGLLAQTVKSGKGPISTAVLSTPHVCLRLSGKAREDGLITDLDMYVVFAASKTFIVQVFSSRSTSAFSLAEWDFGMPLQSDKEEVIQALANLAQLFDSSSGPVPTPPLSSSSQKAEEDFESAKNATDDELRHDLKVWTSLVDSFKEHDVNAAKRTGEPVADPDVTLRPLYRRLANNRFFDIAHENAIHPSYTHEISRIAALRGESYRGDDAGFRLGSAIARYVLPVGVLIVLFVRWTQRIARKTMLVPGVSRFRFCFKLLLKMSWRLALVIVCVVFAVDVTHSRPEYSGHELYDTTLFTACLLLLFLPAAVFLASCWQTERKFARPGPE